MNKPITVLILALFVALVSVNYEIFLESSRIIHILASLLLTIVMYKMRPTWLILSTVFFVGLYKELLDPIFDYMDIFANCVGIVLGYILCRLTR